MHEIATPCNLSNGGGVYIRRHILPLHVKVERLFLIDCRLKWSKLKHEKGIHYKEVMMKLIKERAEAITNKTMCQQQIRQHWITYYSSTLIPNLHILLCKVMSLVSCGCHFLSNHLLQCFFCIPLLLLRPIMGFCKHLIM